MMRRHRGSSAGILLVVGVLCTPLASAVAANAEGDIQLIRLNSYSFFVPKTWMAAGGVTAERATNGGGSLGTWRKPQADPIDATDLTFLRPDRNPAILRDWIDPLPSIVHVYSYRDAPLDFSILRPDRKKWLEVAASQAPDANGFVRVWPDVKPEQQTSLETLLYKGYLNKVGQPLVVFSTNVETPFADHYPSDVFIPVERDLALRYSFSNKSFPENAWWELYQHTLEFLDYLQKPK